MSPLMLRLFTLVGIALAAAMQMKARADTVAGPEAQQAACSTAAKSGPRAT